MEDFYTELMFIGYTLLILLYIRKAYSHHEINSSVFKLFGTILAISGYSYLMYDKYNSHNNKHDNKEECHYENQFELAKGRLLLTIYGFLSFLLPINPHFHLTDIIGTFGNMLLINKYDQYNVIAYSLLAVHYALMSSDIFKEDGETILHGLAGVCLVLYLSKSLVKYYQNYVKKDKKL